MATGTVTLMIGGDIGPVYEPTEEFAELIEREGIIPAPYMARNHWVFLESLDVLTRAELKRLIKDSYGMVAAKLTKKAQAQLGIISKSALTRKR